MPKHGVDESISVFTFLRKAMDDIDVCNRHVLETAGQLEVDERCTDRSKTAANVIVSERIVARRPVAMSRYIRVRGGAYRKQKRKKNQYPISTCRGKKEKRFAWKQ